MSLQLLELEELGKTIRDLRLKAKLTQLQLANKSGFDATYISMLERGHRNPPFLTLSSIARHLDVPLHKLFRDSKAK